MDEILSIFDFWKAIGWEKFSRIFWFLIIFEFSRYLILDVIIINLFYLKRYFYKDRIKLAKEHLLRQNPLVSVIVPGKNEGKNLYKLVQSLKKQTYRNYEIIIVDDGSTDDTPLIGKSLLDNGFIDQFFRNEVRGGKASAANLALRYSKGEFIVHLDADCEFDSNALENILFPFYQDNKIAAVGGSLEVNNSHKSVAASIQAIEYLKVINIGRTVSSFLGIYRIISGAFGAFRADTLKKLGGWDIGPGLDGDITLKIRKSGHRVHFEPSALGYTNAPSTFKKLIKQRLRWDRSVIRFRLRKHRDVFVPNQNFKLTNMLSSFESIFYNVFLNINWYFYILDIIFNFSGMIKFIIILNIFLFTVSNVIKFIIAITITKNKLDKLKLIPFLPLMVIYNGLFLRVVRTIAITRELVFSSSYNDNWNPKKSSKWAKKLKF